MHTCMQIAFSADTYGFYAEFERNPAASQLAKFFPLTTNVRKENGRICFPVSFGLSGQCTQKEMQPGDIFYSSSKKYIYIYTQTDEGVMAHDQEKDLSIFLGRTSASLEELAHLEEGTSINISCKEKKETEEKPGDDTRILNQSEIDKLIANLRNKT